MLAVDTNVVVRYLARDDADQTNRATKVIRGQPIWISKTVLLETAWVLAKGYALPRESIAGAFRKLLGLPTVSVEDELAVQQALDWCEQGLEVADALHLASSAFSMPFATFDQSLVRKARRLATPDVVAP